MNILYSDVEKLSRLIQQKTGLVFTRDKELDLKNAAIKTIEKFGIPSLDDLLRLAEDASLFSNEFKFLVENLTVNETYFFRHFSTVESSILPSLVKGNKTKTIKIWSAGCSSGEEPYTIAMVLNELIPRMKEWSIQIKGTDIDKSVIDIAKSGEYKKWSMRQISDYYLDKYFTKTEHNTYLINDQIKQSTHFSLHNLLSEDYPSESTGTENLDIIFCRNVTIYFGLDDTTKIVKRFYDCLNYGGYLIVGHSEPSPFVYDQFDHMIIGDMVVYQKNRRVVEHIKTPKVSRKNQRERVEPVKIRSIPENDLMSSSLATLFDAAKNFYTNHNYDKSLELLAQIRTIQKNHIEANYLSALIFANLQKFDRALPFLELVLAEDALHKESYYLRALMQKENKNYELAIESLKKALYIDNGFILAYYELLVNHVLMKNLDAANQVYRQLKKLVLNLDDTDNVGIVEHLKIANLKSLVCIFLGREEF